MSWMMPKRSIPDEVRPSAVRGPGRAGAAGLSGSFPCQADDPQAGVEPFGDVVGRAEGVGAFEQEDRT